MKTILFSFLLLSSILLPAQTISSIPLPIDEIIHSEIVGMDYTLKISLPFRFNPKAKTYPVFYYLDAWNSSGGMNEMVKSRMFSKNMEDAIVVGISFEANPITFGQIRARDYCPPLADTSSPQRGDKFYGFLEKELIPFMEEKYNANPIDRGVLGYSLGGLFATWTLKQEKLLFNRLAILSPSLWYGGEDFIFKNEQFLESVKNSDGLKVFISCGSLEGKQMIKAAEYLSKVLSKNEKNEVQFVIFEGEDHGSCNLPATSRAVSFLYERPFKLLIKEGEDFYRSKNYAKSVEKFELAFSTYPKEVDEDDTYNLACLYALNGEKDNAFKMLQNLVDSKKDFAKSVKKDSDLDSLHKDARWEKLLKDLKK